MQSRQWRTPRETQVDTTVQAPVNRPIYQASLNVAYCDETLSFGWADARSREETTAVEGPGVTVKCAHVRGDGPWVTDRGKYADVCALFFDVLMFYPAGVGAPRVWGLPAWQVCPARSGCCGAISQFAACQCIPQQTAL